MHGARQPKPDMNDPKQLLTIGQVVELLAVPHHRVEHALRGNRFRPIGRIGNARVYPRSILKPLAAALQVPFEMGPGERAEQAPSSDTCSGARDGGDQCL